MDTDPPAAPALAPEAFDAVRRTLDDRGPLPAIDRLCDELAAAGDHQALFYARLMRKRVELGVAPFPAGPATDLPAATHDEYEEAIRTAGREAGAAYLARKEFGKAWGFYRMLGEPDPVKAALDAYAPGPDDDPYAVVEIAWQQGVHPHRGFDLVLDRSGVCSAITMVSGADLSKTPDLRDYCVKKLVRALHAQLKERLANELTARGEPVPATVADMVSGRDDLFADDQYHIDISHLSSVVQFALQLSPCAELDLARDLCAYGEKLSANLRGDSHPPFEHGYADYKAYLDLVAGRDAEAGLAHFRAKLPAAADVGDTFPAEVLVNLLLRLDRRADALAVAKQHLAAAEGNDLSCPPLSELARQAGDYAAVAEASRAKADAVNYLAGLIAARG